MWSLSRLGPGPTAYRHGLDNDYTAVERNLRSSAGGIRGASPPGFSDGRFTVSEQVADPIVFANVPAGNVA